MLKIRGFSTFWYWRTPKSQIFPRLRIIALNQSRIYNIIQLKTLSKITWSGSYSYLYEKVIYYSHIYKFQNITIIHPSDCKEVWKYSWSLLMLSKGLRDQISSVPNTFLIERDLGQSWYKKFCMNKIGLNRHLVIVISMTCPKNLVKR